MNGSSHGWAHAALQLRDLQTRVNVLDREPPDEKPDARVERLAMLADTRAIYRDWLEHVIHEAQSALAELEAPS